MWLPEEISLRFLVGPRKPSTIAATLESCYSADREVRRAASIELFPCATDLMEAVPREILQQTRCHVPPTMPALESINSQNGIQRSIHANLQRALTFETQAKGICVCSDDLLFRSGFFTKLLESLAAVAVLKDKPLIISGYSFYDLPNHTEASVSVYLVKFPALWFRGIQFLFFNRQAAIEVNQFIERHGELAFNEPNGLIINRYARTNSCLLATRRSLVQHVGKQSSTGFGKFHSSPTFQLPWPGREEKECFADRRGEADSHLKRNVLCPDRTLRGRGIVICAGGMKYFTCAWVAVRMLRRLGCRLPVELWHLGPEEMTPEMRRLADVLGVRCMDAHEVRKEHPARTLHGWELKCYAILHSRFREVLLMDADNVPAVNPRYLFDTPEYKETGAVFWPDIGSLGPEKDIWKITGVPYNPQPDFESGQILVDKKRCWKALQLAMHYNEHSDFYYQYIYGDKDTFRFAFLKTGTPFSMPSRGIDFIDGTLCQHDFEGRRVFQHRIKKWSFGGKNPRTPGFLHEEACLEYLEELRSRWHTGIPVVAGPKAQLIPRILHRLWLGPEPLSGAQERWAETWRRLHPEWECKVWTAETLPVLINRAEFDGAREAQQRMEIASYELLHQFGGVYVDADFECLRPLDELLAGEECVIGEESPGRICHGFLAGVPGHEFFKHLTRSVRNSLRDHAGKPAVEQTGANFVTRNLGDRWDVTVLPPRYFHPHPHADGANRKRKSRAAKAYALHHPSPRWAPLPEVVYERRLRQYAAEGKTARERAAARALARGVFDYHRMGHDRRRLQFLPDGTFGEGVGGCEKTWDVHDEGGALKLTIFGPGYVTCRAEECGDGVWHGAWLIGEKMPLELTPLAGGR